MRGGENVEVGLSSEGRNADDREGRYGMRDAFHHSSVEVGSLYNLC